MNHKNRIRELEKVNSDTTLPEIIIYKPGDEPVKSNAAVSIRLPHNGRDPVVSDDA